MEKTLQTAEGRLKMLQQAAVDFSRHLETVSCAVLPPQLRLAVVKCARDALTCQACAELQQTCLPKSASFYVVCSNVKHDAPICNENNNKIAVCLTSIVHAIVNHQSNLNKTWFHDVIQAIKDSGLIPRYSTDEGMELACYSAFADVVALTATRLDCTSFTKRGGTRSFQYRLFNPSEKSST